MGLVGYASSSSSDEEESSRKKKRKTSAQPTATPTTSSSPLPPLPASFHDLYASTVRTTPQDDPSLHQGRRRLHPHVAGNWPSHIYVEWHPAAAQHALLTSLVADLSRSFHHHQHRHDDGGGGGGNIKITSFLTSDLGSPLPLHISLSRPIVLRTEEKDAFLEQVTDSILGGGGEAGGRNHHHHHHNATSSSSIKPFEVGVHDLSWHRSPESDRSFLVLRVRSKATTTSAATTTTATNPELSTLLRRCNQVVARYGQPQLYASPPPPPPLDDADDDAGADDGVVVIDETAFHVSIAWSFAEPTAEVRDRTAAVFSKEEYQRGIVSGSRKDDGDHDEGIRIPVDDVKVKIGNVVTSTALGGAGAGGSSSSRRSGGARGLFGI